MKIGIFTRKIDGVMGGMEKQILLIASRIIESGNEVTVVSLDTKTPETFFARHPEVKFRNVPSRNSDVRASIREKFDRQLRIFKVIRESKFEVVISFSTGALWYSVIPAKLNGAKVILAERTGPSVYAITRANKYRNLIFLGMRLCDAIAVQIPSYINAYPRYLHERIKVIPNEVPRYPNVEKYRDVNKISFAYVGRFCYQKQTSKLVEAFIMFHGFHEDSNLTLIGTGEQLEEINNLIESNKAHNYIKLIGSTNDVFVELKGVDVLIHPAIWEGFPNSVAEALAMGIPVAGFNDCEGVRDLVIDGKTGWLLDRPEDVKSIVDLLSLVMNERENIAIMSEQARKDMEQYSKEISVKNWQELISKFRNQTPQPS